MLDTDFTFAHSYEIEEIGDFPGTGKFLLPVISIPPLKLTDRPEYSGSWLKVKPSNGNAWIGVFGSTDISPHSVSRILSTPDPDRVCVISGGLAHVVKADQPDLWEEIPIIPVLDVRPIPNHGLIVFSDFTEIAAYGSQGLAWRNRHLCSDDLKIVKVTPDTIEGTGFDPSDPITDEVRFVIDLKTGRSLLPPRSSDDRRPI